MTPPKTRKKFASVGGKRMAYVESGVGRSPRAWPAWGERVFLFLHGSKIGRAIAASAARLPP